MPPCCSLHPRIWQPGLLHICSCFLSDSCYSSSWLRSWSENKYTKLIRVESHKEPNSNMSHNYYARYLISLVLQLRSEIWLHIVLNMLDCIYYVINFVYICDQICINYKYMLVLYRVSYWSLHYKTKIQISSNLLQGLLQVSWSLLLTWKAKNNYSDLCVVEDNTSKHNW